MHGAQLNRADLAVKASNTEYGRGSRVTYVYTSQIRTIPSSLFINSQLTLNSSALNLIMWFRARWAFDTITSSFYSSHSLSPSPETIQSIPPISYFICNSQSGNRDDRQQNKRRSDLHHVIQTTPTQTMTGRPANQVRCLLNVCVRLRYGVEVRDTV